MDICVIYAERDKKLNNRAPAVLVFIITAPNRLGSGLFLSYPLLRPEELFRSDVLLRVALLRLFSELLLGDTLGRDCRVELFTELFRLGLLVCLWELTRSLLREGAVRCTPVDDRLFSLADGLTASRELVVVRL